MSCYEIIFIVRPDVSGTYVEDLTNVFQGIIAENGGSVSQVEHCGSKNLAYPIKKNRRGRFVRLNVEAPHTAIREFERRIRLNEDVIRFLVVRVSQFDPTPSALAQGRFSKDREQTPETITSSPATPIETKPEETSKENEDNPVERTA